MAASGLAVLAGLWFRELVVASAACRSGTDARLGWPEFASRYYTMRSQAVGIRVLTTVAGAASMALICVRWSAVGFWASSISLAALGGALAWNALSTCPITKAVMTDPPRPASTVLAGRKLTLHHSALVAVIIIVTALQTIPLDGGSAASLMAGVGASFLAATMWHEVLLDGVIAKGRGQLAPEEEATFLGYYAVMTQWARALNLGAVALAIVLTLAALTIELIASDVPIEVSAGSAVIFGAFLVLSTSVSWQIASRLAKDRYQDAQLRPISRLLSGLHCSFVVALMTVVALQVIGAP